MFVTQSLAEIARSKYSDLIIESCPTKIFLPNPEASSPHNSELYTRLGLTERQIEIITEAVPKRHYYYSSPLGKRLVDLTLGPATLSFIGVGSPEDIANITNFSEDDPQSWQSKWLLSRGLKNKARQLKELTNEAKTYSDFHALVSSKHNNCTNGGL